MVAVTTVLTCGKGAAAGAAIGIAAGCAGTTAGTGVAVGGAVGASTAGGAIAGAAATETAVGAVVGAVAAMTSAAGTATTGVASTQLGAAVAAGTAVTGPIGLIVLGATDSSDGNQITYDCWKPVVHDTSEKPSNGILLKDLVCHPHVANVKITPGDRTDLPHIVFENIWNEKFEIEYLVIYDTRKVVCHAKAVCV